MGSIGRAIRAAETRLEEASSAGDDEAAVCRFLPYPAGMRQDGSSPHLLVRCAHLVFRPAFPQTLHRERLPRRFLTWSLDGLLKTLGKRTTERATLAHLGGHVPGAHPKVVQELLGHSQISMTMDTYSQRPAIDSGGGHGQAEQLVSIVSSGDIVGMR